MCRSLVHWFVIVLGMSWINWNSLFHVKCQHMVWLPRFKSSPFNYRASCISLYVKPAFTAGEMEVIFFICFFGGSCFHFVWRRNRKKKSAGRARLSGAVCYTSEQDNASKKLAYLSSNSCIRRSRTARLVLALVTIFCPLFSATVDVMFPYLPPKL